MCNAAHTTCGLSQGFNAKARNSAEHRGVPICQAHYRTTRHAELRATNEKPLDLANRNKARTSAPATHPERLRDIREGFYSEQQTRAQRGDGRNCADGHYGASGAEVKDRERANVRRLRNEIR